METRWKFLIIVLFMLTLGINSCAQSAKDGSLSSPSHDYARMEAMDAQEASPPPDAGSTQTGPRKIIQNADIQMQSDYPQEAYQDIVEEVRRLDGYIAHSRKMERDHGFLVNMEARVPSARLESFIDKLSDWGKIQFQQIGTEEITKQYYDTQARLENAINQREQYQQILQRAEKIEDILAVQREIDTVQERIEVHRGTIEMWDLLVDFSSVRIEITPNPRITEEKKQSAWNPLSWGQMWGAFGLRAVQVANALVTFFQWIIITLPILILLAILGWIILKAHLKVSQKIKKEAKK